MDLGSAPSESVKFQEYLHGLVLGHSELVIDAGGILGTVLRPLPELARVISRERKDGGRWRGASPRPRPG